ncbi:putative Cyanophycinase and related exopeptidase-like protein [Candidatus Promineifilum breve]|uniref:Cyanophycinase and related exopeptidase-like protein n=1 Tax=Candidatus Promineifilum breve TaxID=1806508 RepID=A0A160T6T2_9CHLR|nr:hypothetical protein [Candidatus Promineifilum breve]CUS06096.1 putative Cyanophycinase and related exopeptidase-like protein [Candidatus Promineifilum breve]
MHKKWWGNWRAWAVLAALAGLLIMVGLVAGEGETRLVPIGAGYEEDTLMLFAAQAAEQDSDGHVLIRVLPITYHFNAFDISPRLRRENLQLAQTRAAQIEEACAAIAAGGQTCEATVVDMMIRRDAENPDRVAELGLEVDGFYILGGDQAIAMLVIANTPSEAALAAGFANGAAVGGNSAGAAVISRYMIAGYVGNNSAWDGLHQGAVDLWYGPDDTDRRGLIFGQPQAVIDQHVLERGRTARLLQAMVEKPGDKLAVGYDWGTGGVIDETGLARDVAGWYAAIALDGETYGAAAAAQYVGDAAILAIHDVGYHILPAGPYAYDLTTRRPVVDGVAQDAPDISERSFDHLIAPAGAGALFIGGDVGNDVRGEVVTAFVAAANDNGGPVIVLSAAPRQPAALGFARFWRNRLRQQGLEARPQLVALTPATDFAALAGRLEGAGAIFFTGRDQELMAELVAGMVESGSAAALQAWWASGGVLLADNAAAAALGVSMTAERSPTSGNVEYQSSDTFLDGYLTMAPGLGLVDAVIEPRVLYDYLYGRLVSHVMADPATVAVGLERGAGLHITSAGVSVIGQETAFVVDGRYAQTMAVGDNGAFAATWLLIDTFPTGTVMAE